VSDTPTRELLHKVYASDLSSFLPFAFDVLEPGKPLIKAPYLELLCAALMLVNARAIRRLIVNMPPRHLKSIVTSVVFPAWLLMRNPKVKIALICHSDMLANDLASKTKRLLESEAYRALAPQVQIRSDRDRRMDFETTAGGQVYSASIGSGITGRGFDHIILDDPIAAHAASSEAERVRVQNAFDGMISSRLDDPARGTITVVQQRVHEDDLSGYLLARGGWESLTLPLVAEEDKAYCFGDFEWTRSSGDILLPERFPDDVIERLRRENGEAIFATQWQQNPSSTQGEVIKDDYLKPIAGCPPTATRIFISVDTAIKQTTSSDYTVFLLIATDGNRHYVIDIRRGRWDVTEMRDVAIRLLSQYPAEKVLIEDSASGPALRTLLLQAGHRCELRSVGNRNKEERLQRVIAPFVDGRIYYLNNQPWSVPFRNELIQFPIGKHDDQVDAMTLYLEYVSAQMPFKQVILSTNSAPERMLSALSPGLVRKGEHPMRPRHPGNRSLPIWRR
jgi:predicted phage terminase large subunit-like protein